MILSSTRRLRLHIAGNSADPLEASLVNDRVLYQWLVSVSSQIERYLDRGLEKSTVTEYFDVKQGDYEFFPRTYPINSLTSVYEDSAGLWAGAESEITDCIIGIDDRTIVLPIAMSYTQRKALRIIMNSGYAAHAVNSIFSVTASGTPAVGNYVRGVTSGAMGLVSAWDATNNLLTVENYFGQFSATENLKTYASEANAYADTSALVTCTGVTSSSLSLADSHPAITMACEMQVRYYREHMTDFENAGTDRQGNTIRRNTRLMRNMEFLPLTDEVISLLSPYVNRATSF